MRAALAPVRRSLRSRFWRLSGCRSGAAARAWSWGRKNARRSDAHVGGRQLSAADVALGQGATPQGVPPNSLRRRRRPIRTARRDTRQATAGCDAQAGYDNAYPGNAACAGGYRRTPADRRGRRPAMAAGCCRRLPQRRSRYSESYDQPQAGALRVPRRLRPGAIRRQRLPATGLPAARRCRPPTYAAAGESIRRARYAGSHRPHRPAGGYDVRPQVATARDPSRARPPISHGRQPQRASYGGRSLQHRRRQAEQAAADRYSPATASRRPAGRRQSRSRCRYQPGSTSYNPGQTGYSPPGVAPYQVPAAAERRSPRRAAILTIVRAAPATICPAQQSGRSPASSRPTATARPADRHRPADPLCSAGRQLQTSPSTHLRISLTIWRSSRRC